MANQEHVDIVKQGVEVWNKWREEHVGIVPDLNETYLSGANLTGANLDRASISHTDLSGANLSKANLNGAYLGWANFGWASLDRAHLKEANLIRANFIRANLKEANLSGANLKEANLNDANLSKANLSGAYLGWANLTGANLTGANLTGADLSGALLVQTDLTNANLTGCRVYGISAWDVHLENAIQKDLTITPLKELLLPGPTLCSSPTLYPGKSEITIDNLEVAQFINLLLNNSKIRDVINTITSKVVLILGRFTDERKLVLDALRDELRNYNLSPVVFDFDPSTKRDLTETITTLAHLSRFVIADLTDAKSIPQELQAIVPHLPSVLIQPILHVDAKEYSLFEHFERYPWVLPIYHYQDIPNLLASIKEYIITPIEQKEHEKYKMKALEEENRKLREEIEKLKRVT